MFTPSHMAVGALCEAGVKRKLPTAAVAFASAALLDSTKFWHAPYHWPEDSPAIFKILPHPHDAPSILTLIALIALTMAVAWFLRRYWWGMAWALAPDIIDWVILRPITGNSPIHDLFSKVSTAWGFGLEIAFIAVIVFVLVSSRRAVSRKPGHGRAVSSAQSKE
ncbi:MAG: hypothetical protein JSW38_10410 [Dehalococcoidia bacterium]|nr:MAG: hypothetical protein JSW38_10410 [Dehalococcoidia bacterium]